MENLKWFGHASFSFKDEQGNKIYYVDPFDLKEANYEPADLIFITHTHPDHFDPESLRKLVQPDVIFFAPKDCVDKLEFNNEKVAVFPNQEYNAKGFKFWTFPAYNVNKPYHPKENNWVGFLFNINSLKIYHAGDTDFIPEMKDLKKWQIDVAMLPIGGTYTMNVDEAIEAANTIGAKTTVPIHYKRLLNDSYKKAEEKFKKGVTNSKVEILKEFS